MQIKQGINTRSHKSLLINPSLHAAGAGTIGRTRRIPTHTIHNFDAKHHHISGQAHLGQRYDLRYHATQSNQRVRRFTPTFLLHLKYHFDKLKTERPTRLLNLTLRIFAQKSEKQTHDRSITNTPTILREQTVCRASVCLDSIPQSGRYVACLPTPKWVFGYFFESFVR